MLISRRNIQTQAMPNSLTQTTVGEVIFVDVPNEPVADKDAIAKWNDMRHENEDLGSWDDSDGEE